MSVESINSSGFVVIWNKMNKKTFFYKFGPVLLNVTY